MGKRGTDLGKAAETAPLSIAGGTSYSTRAVSGGSMYVRYLPWIMLTKTIPPLPVCMT